MRELRGFFGWGAVDGGDLDQLGSAWAFLVVAVDPLAEAQVVFADAFRRDEDIVASLLEIFVGHAQETEAFGCEFEHAIDGDFWAAESDRAAFFEFAMAWQFAVAWLLVFAARGIAFLEWCAAAFAFVAAAFAAAVALLSIAAGVWGLALVMRALFVRCLRRWGRLLGLIGSLACGHASAAGHAADFASLLECRLRRGRGIGSCSGSGFSGFNFFAGRAFLRRGCIGDDRINIRGDSLCFGGLGGGFFDCGFFRDRGFFHRAFACGCGGIHRNRRLGFVRLLFAHPC